MSDFLPDYFKALERLVKGRPTIAPKGSKITNDSVSIEAGRGKGSIKKSRPVFKLLIEAIDQAAAEQVKPKNDAKGRLDVAKSEAAKYRALWEQALAREVSLVQEIYAVKRELANLTGKNVLPIRRTKSE